jgi:hypothetical protein
MKWLAENRPNATPEASCRVGVHWGAIECQKMTRKTNYRPTDAHKRRPR